ncbi:hypothetical protein ACQKWADRAFT_296162 [Trichoderma austrokoningii]
MQSKLVEESSLSFHDAERIIGVKLATYVFPHADGHISPEHRRRFAILVEAFQQHLHKHPGISLERSARTEFQLKMCGCHSVIAEPSIIIAHPSDDPNTGLAILKILTQPQIRDQYELHSTTRFQIYLSLRPTFEYLASPSDSFSICIKSSYFPGNVLASGDTREAVSTITCGIRFSNTDDTLFALTPAHIFKKDGNISKKSIQKSTPCTSSEFQATCVLADVEYDLAVLFQLGQVPAEPIVHPEPKSKLAKGRSASDVQHPETQAIMPNRAWGLPILPKIPHMDWTLVEIDPSLGRTAADDPRQVYSLDDEKRAVQVVTSRGSLQGMIRRSLTYITNAGSDSPLCEVWTVTIAGQVDGDVRMGDSGSLVIDTITGQPCGYVIAKNRAQELYVMPLGLAIQQMAEMVPIPNVKPEVFFNLEWNQRPIQTQGPDFRLLMTYFSQPWSRARMEEQRRPAWLRKLRAKCAGGWSCVQMGVRSILLPSIQILSTHYRLMSHDQNNKRSSSTSSTVVLGERRGRSRFRAIDRAGGNDSQDSFATLLNNRSEAAPDIARAVIARPRPTKLPSYGWPITTDNDPINSYGHRIFPGNPIMDARVSDQYASVLRPLPARPSGSRTVGSSLQIVQHTEIHQSTRRASTPLPVIGLSLSRPAPERPALNEQRLPLLPTSLSRTKQSKILKRASSYLSKSALDFFNKHELPNTVIRGMDASEHTFFSRNPGRKRASIDGWYEFVFLLRHHIAEQRVPRGVLNSDLAAHSKKILHASLGIDDALKRPLPVRDDRAILRMLSAGVQVADMLNDEKARKKLVYLLMKTERTMIQIGDQGNL